MTRLLAMVLSSLILYSFFLVSLALSDDNVDTELQSANENDAPQSDGQHNNNILSSNVPSRRSEYVDCYTCLDCPQVFINTSSKFCPVDPNRPADTKTCVVYAEKYKNAMKLYYIRGCVAELGNCADIQRSHATNPEVKVAFCSECDGSRCNKNGVSRSTFDFALGFLVIMIYPILGKYTAT